MIWLGWDTWRTAHLATWVLGLFGQGEHLIRANHDEWEAAPMPQHLVITAKSIVDRIAQLLRDPAEYGQHLERSLRQEEALHGLKERTLWPMGLASGYLSSALLFAHLDRCYPTAGWDRVAHEHLSHAIEPLEQGQTVRLGLYQGIAGLGYVARYMDPNHERYRTLIRAVERGLLESLGRFSDVPSPIKTNHYDLINGITGVLAFLVEDSPSALATSLQDQAIEFLISTTGRTAIDHRGGFFVDSGEMPFEEDRLLFPSGALDLGLAHGIAGVIAALAVATLNGSATSERLGAIERLCDIIWQCRIEGEGGANWPAKVGPAGPRQGSGGRYSWCYRAPGVSRALALGGIATGSEVVASNAVDSFRFVASHGESGLRGLGPTLCHGLAGVLQIALRFWNDTHDELMASFAQECCIALLEKFDRSSSLCYRNEVAAGAIDDPGLLTGAAGIALSLLSVTSPHAPAWDRVLLLA